MIKKGKSLLIVIFLISAALGSAIYLYSGNSQKANFSGISWKRSYWEEKIRTMGAQKAYALFKEENRQNHLGGQHYVAHVFGEALYNLERIGGIAVCDSDFSFGCYHSLFGRAISDQGDEIVKIAKDLNGECIKKYGPLGLGCQHGIGHAILEYLGSSGSSRLDEALEVCLEIQKLAYRGCSMGVFMEYYFPTIIGDEEIFTNRKALDKNNPHYPCEEVMQPFRMSCYFELGKWLTRNPDLDIPQMGRICQAIKNGEHRQSCFLGVGDKAAAMTDFDKNLGLENCKKMPDTDGQIFCVAGLGHNFYVNKKGQVQDICSFLDKDNKQICIDRADITKVKLKT